MNQDQYKIYKKGDLVYVPSRVTLVNFYNDSVPSHLNRLEVKEYVELQKPRNLLVVEDDGPDAAVLGVLYEGETWHVKVNDVYPRGIEDD